MCSLRLHKMSEEKDVRRTEVKNKIKIKTIRKMSEERDVRRA